MHALIRKAPRDLGLQARKERSDVDFLPCGTYSVLCPCGNLAHSDVNAAANIARFVGPIGSVRGCKVTRPIFAHRGFRDVVKSPVL